MSRDDQGAGRSRPTAGVAAPADRRFRRSGGVPVRRRRFGRGFWNAARWIAALAVLGLIGAWSAERIMASDVFLVREIAVRGNTRLSAGDVESLVTGLRGENVFRVDFEHYRQRVLGSSWVEQVGLSRVLPSTIVVEIVERTPMAIGRIDQQLYLVDQTGNIIDEYAPAHRDFDLPIVDGLLSTPRGNEPWAEADKVQLTGTLLAALAARTDLRRRLSQIDVSNPRNAVVMFDDDPTWLHLGHAEFAERLQRYLDLRPALIERFGTLDYVDLRYDERVYVRGERPWNPRSTASR